MSRWTPLLWLPLLLLVGCRGWRDPPPVRVRPNIVLITIDTLRADHLGSYGYFRDTSPTIDALAADAIVFDHAYAAMATTLPSHTSILTSTWPLEHGVLANLKAGRRMFVPAPGLHTFTQAVQAQGYDTAAFISAAPVRRGAGLEVGFAHWDQPTEADRRAGATTDRVLSWLQQRDSDAPFFLWIHYWDPHTPYYPPAPYRTRFKADRQLKQWFRSHGVAHVTTRRRGIEVHRREAYNLYDGEIRYLDDQLARLFTALREPQLWSRTALALVGDHGEGLNQHNEPDHGDVWLEQLRVPMMLRIPGVAARRVPGAVSSVDLFPTLLGQIEVPNQAEWLAQASGHDRLAQPAGGVYSEACRCRVAQGRWSWRAPGWHYLRDGEGGEQLFDLQADPYERVDVSGRYLNRLAHFGAQLQRRLDAQKMRGEAAGAGASRPARDNEVEQLEQLGYVAPAE